MNGAVFDVGFLVQSVPDVLSYLPVTLEIALVSFAIGLVLAFLIALVRFFDVRVLSQLSRVFVSLMRGTPAMCQLLLAYYGLPVALQAVNQEFGTGLSVNGIPPIAFAIVALSLNGAAFMSETIRSAMLSVGAEQLEACYSVNMTRWQAVWYVVLPQAFATALAPLGNTAISMLKDTSLVFNISVVEMMAEAKIVGARGFRFFEVYIVVSLIYWVCCFVLERLISLLEKRSRHFERGVAA